MFARLHILLCTVLVATLTCQASASPVTVASQDLVGHCDVLAPVPTIMDELGTTAVFPLDERIAATVTFIQPDACASSSSPAIPNAELRITNLTANISFTDLHYVADPGTGFTNFDGTINGMEAVRLDNVGVNKPLILESGGSLPLVFEPGETWVVVLDDWSNAAFTAADLGSIGVPSTILPDLSSGSIVALPGVPEPTTMLLTAAASVCLCVTIRRRP